MSDYEGGASLAGAKMQDDATSPVLKATRTVYARMEEIDKLLDILQHRLTPVLNMTIGENTSDVRPVPSATSPLAEDLNAIGRHVTEIAARVDQLIQRIDV